MSNVRPSSQAGFSLVETVAAMGILAMAAIPLLQVTTEANRNAASLESRLLARTVAENEMARAMATRIVLDAGVATGQDVQLGRTYIWTRTTSPAQIGQLQNLRIEVRAEESDQVLATLISLKYTPANLPGQSNGAGQSEEEGR
nr:type II secretion system minor pseudopilin GspI [Hyphomonas sp. Mor2]